MKSYCVINSSITVDELIKYVSTLSYIQSVTLNPKNGIAFICKTCSSELEIGIEYKSLTQGKLLNQFGMHLSVNNATYSKVLLKDICLNFGGYYLDSILSSRGYEPINIEKFNNCDINRINYIVSIIKHNYDSIIEHLGKLNKAKQ